MKQFAEKLLISAIVTALLAAFSAIFNNDLKEIHYVSLAFVLFIFFVFLPLATKYLRSLWVLFLQRFFPKIGILSGNIKSPLREYKCEKSWTKITPSMWYSELSRVVQKRLKRIKMISIADINSSYSLLINPFGDNFPEENLKLHTSFYKICEYIKNGGFFVCSGGAFYAHQNTINSSTCEAVIVKETNGSQSLEHSLLFQEFGVLTTGDNTENEKNNVDVYQLDEDRKIFGQIVDEGSGSSIKRFRAVTEKSSDFIPIVREKGNKSFPVAVIRYGEGYLIHFGMHLESTNSQEFKIVANVLNKIINDKFRKF